MVGSLHAAAKHLGGRRGGKALAGGARGPPAPRAGAGSGAPPAPCRALWEVKGAKLEYSLPTKTVEHEGAPP
jgi:hypothetical protein